MRKRFLVAHNLEETVFPLRRNPRLFLLLCEVATVADVELLGSGCWLGARYFD